MSDWVAPPDGPRDTSDDAEDGPGRDEHAEQAGGNYPQPAGDFEPAAPGYGQQPAPGHGQQPAPGHGQQPAPGHGQQPTPSQGQQPTPGQGQQSPGYPPQPGHSCPPPLGPGYPAQPGPGYLPPPGPGYPAQPGPGYPPPTGPGYPAQPGPGYLPQPGPGYGQPPSPGYGPQPGYGYPPSTPGPGYAVPGQEAAGPSTAKPKRRTALWLALGGGGIVLAAAITLILVLVVASNSSGQAWTLVAAKKAGGLPTYDIPGISAALGSRMGEVRTQFAKMPGVGHVKSTVDGVYNLSGTKPGTAPKVVVFVGLNGTFHPQAVLKGMTTGGERLSRVDAGPHGGTAECGNDKSGTEACLWVTGTTIGFLIVEPSGAEAPNRLGALMIRMRTDLERPSS